MKRSAKAEWSGNLKDGKGEISTQSKTLDNTRYSYKTRFEDEKKGTNPEELLAAAHAGCFTMAVAAILSQKGLTAKLLKTNAIVNMEGLEILDIKLSITGTVMGINAIEFEAITKDAEKTCLISKILSLPISSEAHLEI